VSHPVSELTAYLDGALPAAERAEMESHLAACPACRAERDRLARAIAALSRLPAAPAPAAGFEQRFFARLAREKAGSRERRGLFGRAAWRWLVPALAGGLAAAAVVVYSGERRRERDLFLAEHLELFQSYELVASVGAVDGPDDVEVVAHLDELEEGRP
jgi:anti-sigma factor RsiW